MPDLTFEQVVNMHYAALYRFALNLTRDQDAARDLVQQTCYLWGMRGHQLRDPARLKSWLFTTLHREFLQERRHESRFPHVEVGTATEELPHASPASVDRMDGPAVLDALLQVEEVYRVPLSLFYFEDLSYKDIAEVLEVPTGTIMSRLARGKEQLRKLLAVEADEHREKLRSMRVAGPAESHPHG